MQQSTNRCIIAISFATGSGVNVNTQVFVKFSRRDDSVKITLTKKCSPYNALISEIAKQLIFNARQMLENCSIRR